MSWSDILDTFAALFLEDTKSAADVSNASESDTLDSKFAVTYAKFRREILNREHESGYMRRGMFINREDFYKREDVIDEYHRGYMISENPLKHVFPSAFKEFVQRFPKGVHFRDAEIQFIPRPIPMSGQMTYTPEPVIDPAEYTCDEWVEFLLDGHSISYGCGAAYINANPASKYYGQLAILSSTDDTEILITQYHFEDWIEILVSSAEQILKVDDSGNRRSVVDYFNHFCKREGYDFNCGEYFENRAIEVRNALTGVLPRDIGMLIAEYILYRDLPKYIPMEWGTDTNHMRRLGATEEMITHITEDVG